MVTSDALERRRRLWIAYNDGVTQRQLAQQESVTPARISQLIRQYEYWMERQGIDVASSMTDHPKA